MLGTLSSTQTTATSRSRSSMGSIRPSNGILLWLGVWSLYNCHSITTATTTIAVGVSDSQNTEATMERRTLTNQGRREHHMGHHQIIAAARAPSEEVDLYHSRKRRRRRQLKESLNESDDHRDNIFDHNVGMCSEYDEDTGRYYYYPCNDGTDSGGGGGKGSSNVSSKSSKSSKKNSKTDNKDSKSSKNKPTTQPAYHPPTNPTPTPTFVWERNTPVPTFQSDSKPPVVPTDAEVYQPTPAPNVDNNTTPSSDPTSERPTDSAGTPRPTLSPSMSLPTSGGNRDPPSLSPQQQQGEQDASCTVDSEGLYGNQLGFAEVTEFTYELTAIPTVTAEEIDQFVLESVEIVMAEEILPKIFLACSSGYSTTNSAGGSSSNPTDPPISSSASRTSESTTASTSIDSGYYKVGDAYVYKHDNKKRNLLRSRGSQLISSRKDDRQHQRHRLLQNGGGGDNTRDNVPQRLEGFSSRPPDEVIVGAKCVNQAIAELNCFVVRGAVTTYSREKQSNQTLTYIASAVEQTIKESSSVLTGADPRLLDVTYRDTTVDPIPPEEIQNGGGGTSTDESQNDVVRVDPSETNFGEPYHYALIAVAAVVLLAGCFLCFRRPRRKLFLDDDAESVSDDDSDGGDSAGGDNESAVVPSGQEQFEDEYKTNVANSAVRSKQPSPVQTSQSLPSSQFGAKPTYTPPLPLTREDEEEENEDIISGDNFEIMSSDAFNIISGDKFEDEGHEQEEEVVIDYDEDNDEYGEEEQFDDESSESEEDDESYGDDGFPEEEVELDENDFDQHDQDFVEEADEMDTYREGSSFATGFESGPTYEERLNDDPLTPSNNGRDDSEDVSKTFGNLVKMYQASTTPEASPDQPKPQSGQSFSEAIARAMTQASGERSETDFSPFDIQDDNVYAANDSGTGSATNSFGNEEYEFMAAARSTGSTTSDEFETEEEYSEYEEGDDVEEEYEVEYVTDSAGSGENEEEVELEGEEYYEDENAEEYSGSGSEEYADEEEYSVGSGRESGAYEEDEEEEGDNNSGEYEDDGEDDDDYSGEYEEEEELSAERDDDYRQ